MQSDFFAPKTPNKHQQKTEVTRRKLMNAARRIFAREGFEAARIESIASEAGHTRGAFYAHFNSKEDLFFALLEDQSTLHLEQLRAELGKCVSNEERLAFMRNFYVSRLADKQTSMLVLEFKMYAIRHPKLRAKLAQAHRAIRTKLKLETLSSVLPDEFLCDEPIHQARAAVLQAILHGLALEYAYDPTSLSEQQLSSMLGVIFDAVVGLPAAN